MNLFQINPKDLQLYDYQEAAVEKLRENIRAGVKNQVLCAPTGSGKTIIATYLIREAWQKGKRAVFVADRIALIDQTSAVLDDYGIEHGVIQGNHPRFFPNEPIQVCSPQSLSNRGWPKGSDLIIVDECHSAYKATHKRIARRDCITIGLTATPFARGMAKHYEAVVSVTTTHELIERKWLAPFRVFAHSEPDMTGARVSSGEWTVKEASTRSMPIVGDVVQQYLKHAEGRKFIAFGADRAHAAEIQRQFQAAGVQTGVYVHGVPDAERAEMVSEFRKPDSWMQGLVSVAALAKGFDVESVSCVIIARPLRSSLAEHIQMLGRGLRRDPANPDKECIVLDHAGNTLRFWDRMNAFFEEGAHELDDGKAKKKKANAPVSKEPAAVKCPGCALVHSPKPHCPGCGHEYPVRKRVHQPGELQEIGEGAAASRDTKQEVYSMLLCLAAQRGYQKGWVDHTYRARFGVWPRGLSDQQLTPTRNLVTWVNMRHRALGKKQREAS